MDYDGQLHVGDVATLAQHAVANVREGSGIGQLVPAGGYLYAGGSTVIWQLDLAAAYAARPFFFLPAVSDHDIMNTPDVNFSVALLPARG